MHTLVDIKGKGQYVGTYMGIGVRNNGFGGARRNLNFLWMVIKALQQL
ncbi:MAG: hypothetical protein ACRYFB_11220 [Janthinobacterium lividum]